MCKLVVINKLFLGNRELGYELMDIGKTEVVEMTASQIKTSLRAGKNILGVKISAGNELVLDKEKYFMSNMMKKVHINKLEPLYEAESSLANIFFYVVGTGVENGKQYFDVVNSRFGRTRMTEEMIKAYYPIGVVAGGVKIENDKIIVSDLIKSSDKNSELIKESEIKPEEFKPEDSKENEKDELPFEVKKIENTLDDKIVSVEIEKVEKPKAGETKTQKSKK